MTPFLKASMDITFRQTHRDSVPVNFAQIIHRMESRNLRSIAVASALFPLTTGISSGVDYSGWGGVSVGDMDSQDGLNFEGAFAIPLGMGWAFQLDGLHSSIGSTEFIGGGAQLYWQNGGPWLASLGFAVVDGEFLDAKEFSGGLEFQQPWYSVGARIGNSEMKYEFALPFVDREDNALLMEVYADFFASDTFRVTVGVESRANLYFASAELEWLTPVDGLSVYVNTMVGENDYNHAIVGFRYYFGGDQTSLKSLRNTPRAMAPAVLYSLGNYNARTNALGNEFSASNQGQSNSSGAGPATNSSGTLTISGSGSGFIPIGGVTTVNGGNPTLPSNMGNHNPP